MIEQSGVALSEKEQLSMKQRESVKLKESLTAGHHEACCYAFDLQSAPAIWDYFLS